MPADKLSPFKFYQYLLTNVGDEEVVRFLRMLTFVPLEDLEALERSMQEPGYKPNTAQRLLAAEVTSFVHGQQGLDQALKATEVAPWAPAPVSSRAALYARKLACQPPGRCTLRRAAECIRNQMFFYSQDLQHQYSGLWPAVHKRPYAIPGMISTGVQSTDSRPEMDRRWRQAPTQSWMPRLWKLWLRARRLWSCPGRMSWKSPWQRSWLLSSCRRAEQLRDASSRCDALPEAVHGPHIMHWLPNCPSYDWEAVHSPTAVSLGIALL